MIAVVTRSDALALMMLLTLSFAGEARAATEARCLELGTQCTCSEPLDTDTYIMIPGVVWAWNPDDTAATDKECNVSGQAGAFVEIDDFSGRFTTASSGPPFDALPRNHSITHVLRLRDGEGGMFAGVKFDHGEPHARRGFRYYKYYSSDYSFTSDVPLCNSSKWAQMGPSGAGTGGPLMTEEWSFYDIEDVTGWNPGANGCCSAPGPGHDGLGPTSRDVKGKWIRLEFYMNNTDTTGSPTTFEAYVKNITDDTPEVKIVDSSVPMDYPNGAHWTTDLATSLHPTSPISDMAVNMFRSNNGQACTGYAAFAYFMAAAWDSNEGQRIGAAYEIEGEMTPTPSDSSGAGGSGMPSDGSGDVGDQTSGGVQSSGAASSGAAASAGEGAGVSTSGGLAMETSGGCSCRDGAVDNSATPFFSLLVCGLFLWRRRDDERMGGGTFATQTQQ